MRGAGRSDAHSPDWADLIDELDQQPGDHLITKRRRSAFRDTGLDTLMPKIGEAARSAEIIGALASRR